MKRVMKILTLLFVFIGGQAVAQNTINPDSVCYGSTAESYWVTNNPNSTYFWNVDVNTAGVIVSGQGTNTIVVDWSTTNIGLYADAITLTEIDNSTGCSAQTTLDVEILPLPTMPLGSNETVCEGELIPDLTAVGAELTWYSDDALTVQIGTGNSYATGEVAVGTYTYYVTETLNGCEGPATVVTLVITASPTVSAGSNGAICEGDTYTLLGSGTNNTGYTWSSSGDGTFSDVNAPTPIYTPGAADISTGTVTLTLTATGNTPCGDVYDDMVLTITPAATADAGSDDSICNGDAYSLSGVAANYGVITWSSSGDGTFSDVNDLSAVYTPGSGDVTNESVIITLTATGNGACTDAVDMLTITINPSPTPGPIQHN